MSILLIHCHAWYSLVSRPVCIDVWCMYSGKWLVPKLQEGIGQLKQTCELLPKYMFHGDDVQSHNILAELFQTTVCVWQWSRPDMKLHRAGICPWWKELLSLEEMVQGNMETNTTWYLKKWADLARYANTFILYLPQRSGRLKPPSMSTLHKCLQVSRQARLLKSADANIHHDAERELKHNLSLSRCKFRASAAVWDVMTLTSQGSQTQELRATANNWWW